MNIFKLQQELLSIFNEIEDNYGEITEELSEKLKITQDNLKSKIESYTNVIKSIKSDINLIDEEAKRLADLKKSKNKLIDKLSSIIVEAIDLFGDEDKRGVKSVDYGTGRVAIRRSTKLELNDDKLSLMAEEYKSILQNEVLLGNASTTENISYEEFIERVQDINKEDINQSTFNVSINVNLKKLLDNDLFNIFRHIQSDITYVEISPKIDKTVLKGKLAEDSNLTIGKLVQNKSLTIK